MSSELGHRDILQDTRGGAGKWKSESASDRFGDTTSSIFAASARTGKLHRSDQGQPSHGNFVIPPVGNSTSTGFGGSKRFAVGSIYAKPTANVTLRSQAGHGDLGNTPTPAKIGSAAARFSGPQR